jgi:hypothetical protein
MQAMILPGVAAAGVVAGVAIPNFVKAREAAEEARKKNSQNTP